MNEITSDRTHITCVSANAYYEYSCMLSLAVQCNCVVYYLVHKRKTIGRAAAGVGITRYSSQLCSVYSKWESAN